MDFSMYVKHFSMLLARLRGLLKGCLSIHICIFLYISVTRHLFQLWSQEMQFFLARFVLGHKDNSFSGKLQSSSCVMSPCALRRRRAGAPLPASAWGPCSAKFMVWFLPGLKGSEAVCSHQAARSTLSVCVSCFFTLEFILVLALQHRQDPSLFLRWRCLSPVALKLPSLPQRFTFS